MEKEHAKSCAKLNASNIAAGNVIPKNCDCDGYHTFDELYDHRITLWIALCKIATEDCGDCSGRGELFAWRSKRHSDGELCFRTGTQYVLGLGRDIGKQITYHIPIERWDETNFAETLEKAPEWDGHTSEEVLARLKAL